MRNIYDIIAEQKAMVDINLSSYDLDYTIKHFNMNQETYYMEEGVGETLKNIGRKIVEFIKKLIEKIKEMIRKVIGFFTKSKDDVQRMEEKIAEAEAAAGGGGGGDSKEEKEEDKKEESKPDKKEEPKQEKQPEPEKKEEKKTLALTNSKRAALSAPTIDKEKAERLKKREEERNKRQAGKNIDNGVIQADNRPTTVGKVGSKVSGGLREAFYKTKGTMTVKDFPYLDDLFSNFESLLMRTEDYVETSLGKPFREYMETNVQLKRRIAKAEEQLKGTERSVERPINGSFKLISDYIYDADTTIKALGKVQKETEDELKRIIRDTLKKENQLNESEAAQIQQVSSFIAKYANSYARLIAAGRSHFLQVCWKVTNDYCDRLNKERGR